MATKTKSLPNSNTLGVLPTIAPYLLPEVIAEYIEKNPRVEIVVQEDTTVHSLKLLAACEIDFALASQPIRDARLEVRELFSEELLLALPADHPLTRKRTVSASDLEDEALIVMKEGHCLGDQVLNFCDRSDLHPRVKSVRRDPMDILARVVALHAMRLFIRRDCRDPMVLIRSQNA